MIARRNRYYKTNFNPQHLLSNFAIMEKQKETRMFVNEPEIQNLRWFLKQYLDNDIHHTLEGFARSMGMTSRELGRYLRGEHKPRRSTVQKWAERLGVDYIYLITVKCPFIDYPFEKFSHPKKSGSHVSVRTIRKTYDAMIDEYVTMVREGEVEYNVKVIDLMKRHKI